MHTHQRNLIYLFCVGILFPQNRPSQISGSTKEDGIPNRYFSKVHKKEAHFHKFVLASRMYIFSRAVWESLFQRFSDKEMKLIYLLFSITKVYYKLDSKGEIAKESQNKD